MIISSSQWAQGPLNLLKLYLVWSVILWSHLSHDLCWAEDSEVEREQPRLAVLDFRDEAGLPPFERAALADSVRGAALNAPFMVLTQENMVALLPPGTELASCVGECEVEVGRKLGARYLITGQIGKIDQQLQLLLRLYDTPSGQLKGQATLNASSVGAMQPEVRRAAIRMLSKLSPSLDQKGLTSRTLLFVRLSPSSAQVKLDGFPIPPERRREVRGGFLIPVTSGEHKVSAYAAGYASKEVTVTVREGEPVEARLKLGKLGKGVDCRSVDCDSEIFIFTRPSGAHILINGRDTGLITKQSSLDSTLGSVALSVPAGRYRITAVKNGVGEVSREIVIRADEVYNHFRSKPLVLRSARGALSIDSEPRGAMVRLNGEVIGKTPLKKKSLPARPYWLEVIAEGYKTREELITIERGKTWRKEWKLSSSTATLTVKVTARGERVQGASIWLEDQLLGETDGKGELSFENLETGTHRLQIRHPLYTPNQQEVTLASGKHARRHIRMSGAFGYLIIDTRELEKDLAQWSLRPDATEGEETLQIDQLTTLWGGSALGRLSLKKFKVSAGQHWLQIRPPKELERVFGPSSERYRVKPGETLSLTPNFKRFKVKLELRSGEVKSAVFLDGIRLGETPLRAQIETGYHTLELVASGRIPYKRPIWVNREGWREEINFERRTMLDLSCGPFAGVLSVDGVEVGQSPQSIDVDPGSHQVSCVARGAEVAVPLEVSPGERVAQSLTITPELLGEAYIRRRWWRRGGLAASAVGAGLVTLGLTQLLIDLPEAQEQRQKSEQRWLTTVDPQSRLSWANSWAGADAEARNAHLKGWGLIGTGIALLGGGAVTWWMNLD